ncbi:unnamed protein product [Cylindrotheca closterium]|uniref:AMP-dependent synthetase/ligase domain-containing protein n=1 Tax=Cylindrotheca closterium TaxID=2856 RepID=A0AAD2G9B2_9STRA|nr:unnamed protein product [Cylindrotheca closterium]
MSGTVFVPLQILLVSIDILLSIVTFKWVGVIKKLLASDPVRSVPLKDDPSHRVHADFKEARVSVPSNGARTMYEIANNGFVKHSDKICMRQREFVGWKSPKVKEFSSKVHEWTFADVQKKAYSFGAALRANGCVPSDPSTNLDKIEKPCRMAIFENTCPEWMVSCVGAFSQSIGVVTVYATLGIDSVIEAVVDNLVPVIVCNKTNVKFLAENASRMPSLKAIVYTNDLIAKDDKTDIPEAPSGLKIFSFDDFVKNGDVVQYPVSPPSTDTTAVVMYTSGSTGKPKGVVITHATATGGVAAFDVAIGPTSSHRYLGYLPLAHIMELMVQFLCFGNGTSINYADPKSLTQTGAYPIGALEQYSPTHMVAVPKVWDTIKKGLLAKVGQTSPVAQVLVHTAIQWRTFAVKLGLDTPLFNALVFKKFKKAVGGHLEMALSGGGPLSGEVQEFIRVAFDVPLIQGYGLTETCAGLAIADEGDGRPGVAGVPIASVEVKLQSIPDVCDKGGLPYMSTDRKDVEGNPVWGRGEILVKGSNVTSGYYMMPDKTKEVYSDDGWFATGDIGQFLSDGSIRIVDRKKNLVKLKSGEYVALEKMEMVYGNSSFVDAVAGGICCYADGDMDRPVALFQLSKPITMKWAKEIGIPGDFETVKKSKDLYNAIMASFIEEHAKSDLSHIEKLKAATILTDPWTSENGCLTAASKLQRRVVVDSYPKEFEAVKKKGIF